MATRAPANSLTRSTFQEGMAARGDCRASRARSSVPAGGRDARPPVVRRSHRIGRRPDMNPRRLPTFAFAAALLLVAAGAPDRAEAQREGCTYVSYAQPDVLLVSSAEDDVAARANMPVLAGDSLVTGVGSRAEAVLADGNVVRVDGYTELRFERMARTYEADDDRDLLFLVHGTAAVEVRDVATRERALRFDTDDATILVASRGLFRVDAGRRGSEVYVLSGKVEVQGRGGRRP